MNRAFLQGFLQGFHQGGGTQKVANWTARKIGTYDIYDDPIAMQEYQKAKQIGTEQAQNNFAKNYGQYIDTGEDTTPTEMFFGKETPTYMGMNKGQFLNTAVQALSSGAWDENEFGNIMAGASEAYGEDLTNNPFLSAFMQEQPDTDPISDMFSDPITNAAFQGNELAQKAMIDRYGETLGNYYDTPEEFVNPDERASYLQNEIFAQPEEDPNFYENINNPIEFLAARAALDENYNLEGEVANYNAARETTADDITAQMVRTYMERMQPEQKRIIDFGDYGLPGGEVPIDDVNSVLGILNTSLNYRKFNQPTVVPENNDPASDTSLSNILASFGYDLNDYAGKSVNGYPVIETVRNGRLELTPNGVVDYTGQLVQNESTESKNIIGKYNGRDITLNKSGYVVYADDDSLVTNEKGNYLKENPNYMPGGAFNPYMEVPPIGKETIPTGNEKNYWGDYEGWDWWQKNILGNETDNQNIQSQDNTQTKSSIDDIISQFREANPDLTYAQIAQRLSERDPVEFKQRTGLNLNAVRDRLRRMR